MAMGAYVDGVLTNAYYDNRLTNGRAELTLNGSLVIHGYAKEDEGSYIFYSEYRRARFDLDTFGMYFHLLRSDAYYFWYSLKNKR